MLMLALAPCVVRPRQFGASPVLRLNVNQQAIMVAGATQVAPELDIAESVANMQGAVVPTGGMILDPAAVIMPAAAAAIGPTAAVIVPTGGVELPPLSRPDEADEVEHPPALQQRWWRGVSKPSSDAVRRYGGAYLACSVSLSLVSISLFYTLVSAGINVAALFSAVGITLANKYERLGTFGLAYLLHKAASPVRFPPTLALTVFAARHWGRWRRAPA